MYIKSMVLEGFKSYGKRIEITGFDKEFNAITGFNGSGKSNILDAICFVLGISNLSQVRATSLQDLVYKSGQAGIQQAAVTITFDNHDRESSPVGYEDYQEITITRQVVIGGKNKYLINGITAPNKRVQDLFCSVQLNVNNPHFLIMQGRITKVLNMKPAEILSMIEEAAGTSMYEAKKQAALQTIEKKDSKLQQINDILQEEIGPKLDKLKEEKVQYITFQRLKRELEHCQRVCIAWKYNTALNNDLKAQTDVQDIQNNIDEKQQSIVAGEEEIKEIENKLIELSKKRDAEIGGKLEELEQKLKDAEKVHLRLVAKSNSNKESVKASEKTIQQLKTNIIEDENMLLEKAKKFDKVGGVFQKLKEEEEKDSQALIAAQEMYQKISSGLLQTTDGENATLEQQLINAKQSIIQAQTELQQCEMALDHNKNQLNKKLQDMRNTEDEYKKDNKDLELKEKELKNIENQFKRINYKEGYLEDLQKQKHSLMKEIELLQEKVHQFECQYPQIRFNYKDPEPNFDRRSVKGLVCTLLSVKDKKAAYALDLAAGGKLYNVIVNTEITAKKILQKGELQQRVTIVPLNKVNGRFMDGRTIELAQKLVGSENVQPALSLIDFPEETRPAMNWIFGQIFICKDMEIAKKIAFHEKIMKKCVTLEGDVFDPSGTLSGGAASKTGSILLKLDEFKEIQNSLKQKQKVLAEIEATIANVHKKADDFASLKQKFDLQSFEISMVKQRLQQTTHHQIKEEAEALKNTIENLKQRMTKAKQFEKENTKKAAELEVQLKDATNIHEKQLKEAENRLAILKEKAIKSRAEWQEREQESKTLELEITELKKTIESGKEQLQKEEDMLTALKENEQSFEQELKEANDVVTNFQENIKEQKEIIQRQNKDMQKLNERKENIIKQNEEMKLDLKRLSHKINTIRTFATECRQKISELTRKYQWIEEDKQYFGKAGGMYDFTTNKPEEMNKKLQELEVQCKMLSRNVNTRAINLLDKEEEQYNEMIKKKKIVENDKRKILETIHHLDEKKKETLLKAWEQVNRDFGSIFSSLLPGADAKLQPPENKTVMDGLEVKIGFSGVWKESLGELSGGQRSLVALSLILAMLLFKPAPLYILDEVDAALDLSHTENIGIMLKRHFKHSQFIVVSLKDGMFNNANVLFTTRFVDGMSTVSRTERSHSSNNIK